MGTRLRRAAAATGLALLAAGLGSAAAHAAPAPGYAPYSGPLVPAQPPMIDGFAFTDLPASLGERVSEHHYTFDGVEFRNLVWESRGQSGYRVDLNAHVLRGERLTDLPALREYLTGYLERDPDGWSLTTTEVGGHPAFAGDRDVFWLVEPGVGIWLSTQPGRLEPADLLAVAAGTVPVDP